jgi:hypothetical protein
MVVANRQWRIGEGATALNIIFGILQDYIPKMLEIAFEGL